MAHLPVAKDAQFAEPLIEAVAPVNIRDGGLGDFSTEERRRGMVALEKRKAPLLWVGSPVSMARNI
jgi:hypothetical protein